MPRVCLHSLCVDVLFLFQHVPPGERSASGASLPKTPLTPSERPVVSPQKLRSPILEKENNISTLMTGVCTFSYWFAFSFIPISHYVTATIFIRLIPSAFVITDTVVSFILCLCFWMFVFILIIFMLYVSAYFHFPLKWVWRLYYTRSLCSPIYQSILS